MTHPFPLWGEHCSETRMEKENMFREEEIVIEKILDLLVSIGKESNINESARANSVLRILQFVSATCAAEVATESSDLPDICKELHEGVVKLSIRIFDENRQAQLPRNPSSLA